MAVRGRVWKGWADWIVADGGIVGVSGRMKVCEASSPFVQDVLGGGMQAAPREVHA